MADGSVLDADRIYTMATVDFLAAGGDVHDMLSAGQSLIDYGGDVDALAAYLATNPDREAEPAGRVKPARTDGAAEEGHPSVP